MAYTNAPRPATTSRGEDDSRSHTPPTTARSGGQGTAQGPVTRDRPSWGGGGRDAMGSAGRRETFQRETAESSDIRALQTERRHGQFRVTPTGLFS